LLAPSMTLPAPAVRDAEAGLDEGAIRVQLERILASDAFDAPPRNRNFLRYVVDETLAGRAGRIKAYSVALEVFRRPSDFDAQIDPVVRIAAARLRRSLERYYLIAGQSDRVRIDLPKGGYVPSFTAQDRIEASDSRASIGTGRSYGAFLVVRPSGGRRGMADEHGLAAGISEELIGALVGDQRLAIVAENVVGIRAVPGFVLEIGIRERGRQLRVVAQLFDQAHDRSLGVYTVDHTIRSKDKLAIQEQAGRALARTLAGSNGGLTAVLQLETECGAAGKHPASAAAGARLSTKASQRSRSGQSSPMIGG